MKKSKKILRWRLTPEERARLWQRPHHQVMKDGKKYDRRKVKKAGIDIDSRPFNLKKRGLFLKNID